MTDETPAGETRRMILEAARQDRQYGELPDWDEEPWPDYSDPYELDEALLEADRVIRAGRHIQARIKAVFQADIEEHGAIRIGGTVYGDKPARKRVLINPEGLIGFAGPDLARIVRVDTSNVRVTQVRQIAVDRGMNPEAVEDTFFEWEGEWDRVLNPLPVNGSRTPKWAKELDEGERRPKT